MSILRHATTDEMCDTLEAALKAVCPNVPIRACAVSSWAQIVRSAKALITLPAILIIPQGSDYTGQSPRKFRQAEINILILGEYHADIRGADRSIWTIADLIVNRFLPQEAEGTAPTHVTLDSVLYWPVALRAVDVDDDRTAFNLLLTAVQSQTARAVFTEIARTP
jgi:hypothetical protein